MQCPSGQEYSEAVQNPQTAFRDPDLQRGLVETTRLGLPKPRPGNFAVVYRINGGARTWAVKCFTRGITDHKKRYEAISARLRELALPYTVGFEYVENGIRVRGSWLPIVKMEWVAGEPLIKYVESRVGDRLAILSLADRWVRMLRSLREAGVAHGDLQHGNVLIVCDELKLVDYDGMFVSALAGLCAAEVGHPNYQHPGRSKGFWSANLDNFSAWTVYVSLIALSVDPTLWRRFGAGDDCLLFKEGDLAAPERSPVFAALRAGPHDELAMLVDRYRELLNGNVEDVPPIDEDALPKLVPSVGSTSKNWLEDHLPRSSATTSTVQSTSDGGWVLDFLAPLSPPEDARFCGRPLEVLVSVGLSLLSLGAVIVLQAPVFIYLVCATSLLTLALFLLAYLREPGVVSRRNARTKLHAAGRDVRRVERQLSLRATHRTKREVTRDRDLALLDKEVSRVEAAARKEVDRLSRDLARRLKPTAKLRRGIDRAEKKALQRVAGGVGARVRRLQDQLQSLGQAESSEITRKLSDLQKSHVATALWGARISPGRISGIGAKLSATLAAHGLHTAQDVQNAAWRLGNLPGFGPQRAGSVLAWAREVEHRARMTMPRALPPSEVDAIHSRYEGEKSKLTVMLHQASEEQRAEEQSVKASFAQERERLDRKEAAPRAAVEDQLKAVEVKRDTEVRRLEQEQLKVTQQTEEDLLKSRQQEADLRLSLRKLRFLRARAKQQVKSYASLGLGRFARHVARLR